MIKDEIDSIVQESLLNIHTASKDQLIEAVEVLLRRALDAESKLEYGLDIPEGLEDFIDVVFSTEKQKSEVISEHYRRSMSLLQKVTEFRYNAAATGAMRWPWSQEAALHLRIQLSYS